MAFILKLPLIFSILLFGAATSAAVQVFPTRLVLSESKISGHLTLSNSSGQDQEYDLRLVFFQMRADGGFDRLKDIPDTNPLLEKLKFSPSRISLKAREKQVIRVMVAEFGDLPNGEFYLHLEAIPKTEAATETKEQGKMQLKARVSLAVPVVVRKGTVEATPEIAAASYQSLPDGGLEVELDLQKTGPGIVFGDLEILESHLDSQRVLTTIKGISSYIQRRKLKAMIPEEALARHREQKGLNLAYRFSSNEGSSSDFSLSGAIAPKKRGLEQPPSKTSAKQPGPRKIRAQN